MPRRKLNREPDYDHLHVLISKEVNKELRELIARKYKTFERGLLSWEVEQALMNWIALHRVEHAHTQIQTPMPTPNPPARVFKVFRQVKAYIEKEYGTTLERGAHIGRPLLEKAIMAIRGSDSRTIRNWLEAFHKFELIKPITAGVWELL